MPYDIHLALERLETNLQKLDSARKQVETTVSESDKLRKTVDNYVASITSIYGEIQNWKKQLEESKDELTSDVHNALVDIEKSCNKIASDFKVSTEKNLNSFSEQNKTLTQRVGELDRVRKDVKAAKDEVKAVEKTLEKLTNALTTSQDAQDKALDNILGGVKEIPVTVKGYTKDVVAQIDNRHLTLCQKIDDASSKIKTAISKLGTLSASCLKIQTTCDSLQSSCDKISSSMAEVEREIETAQESTAKSINVNRWIMIVGIIILAIIHFVI